LNSRDLGVVVGTEADEVRVRPTTTPRSRRGEGSFSGFGATVRLVHILEVADHLGAEDPPAINDGAGELVKRSVHRGHHSVVTIGSDREIQKATLPGQIVVTFPEKPDQ
jgi:hypothetical protein